MNSINFSPHACVKNAGCNNDNRTTQFYTDSRSARKLSLFLSPFAPSTLIQFRHVYNTRKPNGTEWLRINIETTQGRKENEGYRGGGDKRAWFQGAAGTRNYSRFQSIWVDHLTGCRGWLWVSGWSRTKFIILRRPLLPPSLPILRPAAIFAPFSSDLGQPSLRGAPPPCPSHFYDLIQVSNFPINEHGGTGEQWVGRSEFLHVHDLHVPALETGRKRIRKLFFFFSRPGSWLSRPFNPFPSNK